MNWKDCIAQIRRFDPLFAKEVESTVILYNFLEGTDHLIILHKIALSYPEDYEDFSLNAIKIARKACIGNNYNTRIRPKKIVFLELIETLEKARSDRIKEIPEVLFYEDCTYFHQSKTFIMRCNLMKNILNTL